MLMSVVDNNNMELFVLCCWYLRRSVALPRLVSQSRLRCRTKRLALEHLCCWLERQAEHSKQRKDEDVAWPQAASLTNMHHNKGDQYWPATETSPPGRSIISSTSDTMSVAVICT